jgi:DNA-binding transcriptional LysR family regulator
MSSLLSTGRITDLKQLLYFVTVAEELHFGRAADRLHISQPPLSQSIQRLERELGLQLLVRNRRNVALTEAGQILLKEARVALTQGNRFRNAARQLALGKMGTLRIGYTLSVPFLPAFMSTVRSFRAESPEVGLELFKTKSSNGIDAVHQSMLDVAVIRKFVSVPSSLDCTLLTQDRFMLILPRTHPLARRKSVAMRHLMGETFVEYPREDQPGLHDYVRQTWLNGQAKPSRIQEASDTLTIMALVAAGLGVSILPNTLRAIKLSDLIWRESKGLIIRRQVKSLWSIEAAPTPLP